MFQMVAVFGLTLGLIMTRPKGLKEAYAAAIGAALMLLVGGVGWGDAVTVLAGQWDVFLFFLGLMTIAAVADSAGFFNWAAALATTLAHGSGPRLFLNVFLLGTLICAFLSNDATALILTPIVYSLVTRLKLDPRPFMFACTFIADTASFLLPVANPINILVLQRFPDTLPGFLRHLLPASVLCIAINIGLFFLIFRRSIPAHFEIVPQTPEIASRPFFRYTCGCLVLVAVGYIAASLTQTPVSLVAMGGAGLLVAGGLLARRVTPLSLGKELSWSLFLFVGGMFIVIAGVERSGLTGLVGGLLGDVAGGNVLVAVIATVAIAAIGANLINNVPLAIVLIAALGETGAHVTPQVQTGLVYATIFGADLGPNITTVGSLATVLWLVILRRKGLDISPGAYFRIGISVAPVMLLVGGVAIWASIAF